MSTIRATNAGGPGSGTTTNFMSGLAKAWWSLNGQGTIAGRQSFNISGYTDNGAGDYTESFTSAMSAATYGQAMMGDVDQGSYNCQTAIYSDTHPLTTASRTLSATTPATVATDVRYAYGVIYGDLA